MNTQRSQRRTAGIAAILASGGVATAQPASPATPPPATPPAAPATAPAAPAITGVAKIRHDAKAVTPLVSSDAAKAFIAASERLPNEATRVVRVNKTDRSWLTPEQAAGLPADQQADLDTRELGEQFYYTTGYGSPLVYARAIEIAAEVQPGFALAGKRVLDFGYGNIGQLRLMALCGAHAVGVDVDPKLAAFYREPGDQGPLEGGSVTLVHGRWPAEDDVVSRVRAAAGERGYDLIISKNTLKNGYINPARPAPESQLVKLGVEHDAFLRAMHDALAPGGLVVIYNLSPRLSAEDETYRPWTDGRSPFSREQYEEAGFQVLRFDHDETAAARAFFEALGYPWKDDKGRDDLFGHVTVLKRPG